MQEKKSENPDKSQKKPAAVNVPPETVPCVHRGERVGAVVCQYCPASAERVDLDVYSCAKHKFCSIRDRGSSFGDVKLTACRKCQDRKAPTEEKSQSNPLDAITACVTHFNRPESLARCIASIQETFPGLKIDVEPTGGNLSAARNRLAARCQTPYYLMLEEDFVLDKSTDLKAMLEVLEHDKKLAGVSAITLEPKREGTANRGGRIYWCREIARVGKLCTHHESRRDPVTTPGGVKYTPCDLTLCFGLFRTDVLRAIPFDEKIPVCQELIDWFWRVWMDARWHFGLIRKPMVTHLRDRPGPEYNRPRNRNFNAYLERKHGVKFTGRAATPADRNGMPNIIYLTTGRANSTINTRMAIEAFGFHAGNLDKRFYEETRIREENRRLWREPESALDRVKVERILRRIPQPWILKEPCWARTLERWWPVLRKYHPHLVYIDKDPAVVDESIRKAGWNVTPELHDQAREQFEKWRGPKTKLSAEQIGAAVSLFDPSRMAAQLGAAPSCDPPTGDGPQLDRPSEDAEAVLNEVWPGWENESPALVENWKQSWQLGV